MTGFDWNMAWFGCALFCIGFIGGAWTMLVSFTAMLRRHMEAGKEAGQ